MPLGATRISLMKMLSMHGQSRRALQSCNCHAYALGEYRTMNMTSQLVHRSPVFWVMERVFKTYSKTWGSRHCSKETAIMEVFPVPDCA